MEQKAKLVLDLGRLVDDADLDPSYVKTRATAASVALRWFHGERADDPCVVESSARVDGRILRSALSDRAEQTFRDRQQATEYGAEAIAVSVVRHLLGWVVSERMPKRTGADYRIRPAGAPEDDQYERLECSGIGDGADTVGARLREKVQQLASEPHLPRGYAVVTRFRATPVEIGVARYER